MIGIILILRYLMDFQLSIIFHCIIGQYSPRFLITMVGATTFSITTLSIKEIITFDIQHNDTQHKSTLPLYWMSLCWVSRFVYCYVESHYAECQLLFIAILNVIMLSFVILSVVMLSVHWVSWRPIVTALACLSHVSMHLCYLENDGDYYSDYFSMNALVRGYRP